MIFQATPALIRCLSASQIMNASPSTDLVSFYKGVVESEYFNYALRNEDTFAIRARFEKLGDQSSHEALIEFLNQLHYQALFIKKKEIDPTIFQKKIILFTNKVETINQSIFKHLIPQIQLSTTQLVDAVYQWRKKLDDLNRIYIKDKENILYVIQNDMVSDLFCGFIMKGIYRVRLFA